MAEFTKGCNCDVGYLDGEAKGILYCKLHAKATAMFDLLKAIYRTKLYPERFTVKIEKIIGEVEK